MHVAARYRMLISKFYAGRSLFITGGSGFIGKQVIEKLLRSCSDIDRIYVLMRAKKEQSPRQRLQKMLSSAVCLAKHCVQISCSGIARRCGGSGCTGWHLLGAATGEKCKKNSRASSGCNSSMFAYNINEAL